MTKINNDGGPAFPITDPEGVNWIIENGYTGMTLRDYFAGQAMSGLVSFEVGERLSNMFLSVAQRNAERETGQSPQAWFAEVAYTLADAMLRQRENRQ